MSSPERTVEEGGTASPPAGDAAHHHDSKSLHLYNVLGINKKATDDDIKRAYRKLALKYHPDKNLDGDPEKTEKFKEINYANGVLSNPKKRKVYDEMGDTGLKLMEQFGEDNEALLTWMLKPWFKWVFFGFGLLTCGFFCCCCGCMFCCKCCCNFCCGKYTPVHPDDFNPDDLEGDSDPSDGGNPPIVISSQPQPQQTDISTPGALPTRGPNGEQPTRPAVIAMPPPPDYGSIETSH